LAQARTQGYIAEGLSVGRSESNCRYTTTAFFTIRWDEQTRVIAIRMESATPALTAEDFKNELRLFASQERHQRVESWSDVSAFSHEMASISRKGE
jgi:hypothetical protein